ncbi:MAG: hypothetical protein Q8K10_16000 [Methylobacter sp.]|nr:hypothetical protein [Methylobacter sp.]
MAWVNNLSFDSSLLFSWIYFINSLTGAVMGQIKNMLLHQLETDAMFAENYWLQQEQIEPQPLADEAENTPLMNGYQSFDELPF